jgi:hypothetical protein
VAAAREEALNYFNKPLLPVWHTIAAEAEAGSPGGAKPAEDAGDEQPSAAEVQG